LTDASVHLAVGLGVCGIPGLRIRALTFKVSVASLRRGAMAVQRRCGGEGGGGGGGEDNTGAGGGRGAATESEGF